MDGAAGRGTRTGDGAGTDGAGPEGWRLLDGHLTAWFDAPSASAGARLLRHAVAAAPDRLAGADVRAGGVRLQLGDAASGPPTAADAAAAREVSAAAGDLGLVADPAALQLVHLSVGTTAPSEALRFWRTVSGYDAVGADRLQDPDRRHPRLSLRHEEASVPLRGRLHLDVVRPAAAVERARADLGTTPYGVYGLTLADPDGTEVDLVPGDPLGDGPATDDWHVVFGAVVRYPATPDRALELVETVARLSDDAGLPLLVDVRPDGTTVDSGKDRWEDEVSGGGFPALAAQVQAAAHALGHRAATTGPRFVQVGIDAVDVPAVQAFWAGVLGYEHDGRPFVTDLVDPRGLGPVLLFQPMDPADTGRLHRPVTVRPELVVPEDQAGARLDAALAAGGRVLREAPGRLTLADPEGDELDLVTG